MLIIKLDIQHAQLNIQYQPHNNKLKVANTFLKANDRYIYIVILP